MITGGRTTSKSREQGCFLFACGFACLFFIFDGVNSKSKVVSVLTGNIKETKVSAASLKIMVLIYLRQYSAYVVLQIVPI